MYSSVEAGSLYTQSGQRKYLTPAERQRFIEAANASERADVRTLCLTLADTGCRISEALALTGRSIQLDGCYIAIRSLKKRKRTTVVREVPVPIALLNALQETHGIASGDPGAKLWTICRSRAWQLVKSVMKRAVIAEGPHMTCKGLRHSLGIHAIRSGVPLNLVQRWLGHARMETTAIYLQAMGSEEREIAARMWRQ